MKTYNKIILFLLVIGLQSIFGNESISAIRERIYLQTDKQIYLSGELLWMKLYLTDNEGEPASFSKVGYVELLDGTSAQVQVKLEITDATGAGWLEIPSTIPTGYYKLVAYTQQMRNEGESVFFQKEIGIINTFTNDQTIETDSLLQTTLASVVDNNISVTTDRDNYHPRTQTELKIQGLPENVHSIGISVAGKDLAPVSGNINITQWNNQLPSIRNVPLRSDFIPEYEGHIIQGKIVDVSTGESSINEKVSPLVGFVGDQIRLFGGQVDNEYNVKFFTKRIGGVHELATTTFSPSAKQYRVDIQSPFADHPETMFAAFKLNPKWKDQLLQRSMGLQVLHTFTADSLNKIDTTYSHYQFKPDRSYLLDEYTRFTTMEEVMIEFIPSLRFRKINDRRTLSVLNEERTAFSIGNSLAMLDGVPVSDHESIFRYDPYLVRKIDVYRGKFIFGEQFFDGVIFFSTYNLDYPNIKLDEATQFFDYEGTQSHRHFFAPTYTENKDKRNRIPDYRHTLLWQPEIETNGSTSFSIPFSTSDLTGEYQVTVEGITKDGKVIRGTTHFNVNE